MVIIKNLINIIFLKNNSKHGFTLVELLVTISIFSIVISAAGAAIYSTAHSYALTKKMLDDEYNARLALLSITREIHRGITEVLPENSSLTMRTFDEDGELKFEVTYTLEADEILRRNVIEGETPVAFAEVELREFRVTTDGRWVNIKIAGKNGLKLETTVSTIRIPVAEAE